MTPSLKKQPVPFSQHSLLKDISDSGSASRDQLGHQQRDSDQKDGLGDLCRDDGDSRQSQGYCDQSNQ